MTSSEHVLQPKKKNVGYKMTWEKNVRFLPEGDIPYSKFSRAPFQTGERGNLLHASTRNASFLLAMKLARQEDWRLRHS